LKTELEPQDIQLIAERVVELLKPLLSNGEKYGNEDIVFTVESLSEYLKTDVSWVRKQVSAMTIPFFKTGKYVRFRKTAIDKWIKSQTREPLSPCKLPKYQG
jgi:excisionase family DNA binding protein